MGSEMCIRDRVKDNTCALNASKALREAHLDAQRRTRDSTKLLWKLSVAWISNDTEAGVLSGISRKRSIRSSPYWFTEFCNSQCLSHFAAPFIVVRAETSVAESCNSIELAPSANAQNERSERGVDTRFVMSVRSPVAGSGQGEAPNQPHHPRGPEQAPQAS